MKNYETKRLETERLIIDKGTSEACKKIYEYDLTKCTGIDGRNELVKFEKEIDFIGNDSDSYYKECENDKLFDWYIFLRSTNEPVANIIADRENEEEKSIEVSYNTHPKYWGNGYVPEALKEISNYLKSLGYKKIVAHFYEGNEKSKRVCEKLGFKFQKKELEYFKPGDKFINDYEYILYL